MKARHILQSAGKAHLLVIGLHYDVLLDFNGLIGSESSSPVWSWTAHNSSSGWRGSEGRGRETACGGGGGSGGGGGDGRRGDGRHGGGRCDGRR